MRLRFRIAPRGSFRITDVPRARKLWRIAIVSWIVFAIGAAHEVTRLNIAREYEKIAATLLGINYGSSEGWHVVAEAFGLSVEVILTLVMICGFTTGLITLIAAAAVSLKDSWGPPPEIESPLTTLSSFPRPQDPNHVSLLSP